MPIATGMNKPPEKKDLVSCPGGYIKIRRMTYGEKMHRKSFMSKMKVSAEAGSGNRADRRSKQAQAFSAELDMMNEAVTQFEFATSIVEHNLTFLRNPEDVSTETPLDFTNPDHVKMLDGTIGEEIDDIITNFNDWESDDEVGKSAEPSTQE